jgi:DNA-binding GntR family transcriptional regulator
MAVPPFVFRRSDARRRFFCVSSKSQPRRSVNCDFRKYGRFSIFAFARIPCVAMMRAMLNVRTRRAPAAGSPGRTLSGAVLEDLRRDILECRWTPGAKLRFAALRRRYDVGLSPLREALSRLAVEGLVVGEDRRGFRVAPASIDDLDEITALRCELEGLALRWSIERGGDAWEAEVVGAFHHLSRFVWRTPGQPHQISAEWEKRHAAFHHALSAACGSARLSRLRAQFFDQTNRYRRLSVSVKRAPRDDRAEHRALMEATLARDADRAVALMQRHIRRTAELVRGLYARTPSAVRTKSATRSRQRPAHETA